MYCPHCGEELKDLELQYEDVHYLHDELVCQNPDCGTHLMVEDHRPTEQEGRTEIIMH